MYIYKVTNLFAYTLVSIFRKAIYVKKKKRKIRVSDVYWDFTDNLRSLLSYYIAVIIPLLPETI